MRPKHLSQEFAFRAMLVASFAGRGRKAHQETFRLVLHCNCMELILPHDRAIFSKARSYRKAGFWYGLFFRSASPSPPFSSIEYLDMLGPPLCSRQNC